MTPAEVKILAAMAELIGTESRHHPTTFGQLNVELLNVREGASQRAAAVAGKKWLSDLGPSTVVTALAEVVRQRAGDGESDRPERVGHVKDDPAEPKIRAAVTKLIGADSPYANSVVQNLTAALRKAREAAALRAAVAAEGKWLSALGPRVVVAALAKVTKQRTSQKTVGPAEQNSLPG